MCRVLVELRELVKQRLAAAAEEIFELLEKTITEYEEHIISKYERQRRQEALYVLDGGFLIGAAEDQCESPHIKEKQDVKNQLCSGLRPNKRLSVPTWNTRLSSPQPQPGVSGVPEPEKEHSICVKTEEGDAWTPTLHHTSPVPQPPAPVLLQHNQTEEEPLPHNTLTGEQLDMNQTVDCVFPLAPPGTARLHQDSMGKVCKRRGSGVSQKRPHECPLCGLRFQSHFNLETHLRVHTGERPFSCPVCEKTFNRKDSMANHMKIHLGETFCCSECGKHYSDKSNLRRHTLSVHTGKGHMSRPAAEPQDVHLHQIT